MDIDVIIQRIRRMYLEYGVDTSFLDALDDKRIIKGMKGILAELDLNKKKDYTQDDIKFIQEIYSMFCQIEQGFENVKKERGDIRTSPP